ncbi:alpha/beta hydrolase [Actinomadura rudentiformis]|uniref:Alpha/beta hydrolase n=1 Tax=Actinomadura rudentiformis TaxID=359158 RepID=A0A6H9Y9L7_9ACTN|nr:alpha/beta hydrolase [Actinomadura rudentiformis]KAB2341828.1 alpha/beta hydrolase [Actinomadura rudentiformis]
MKRLVLITAATALGVGGTAVAVTAGTGGTARSAAPVAAATAGKGIAWGACTGSLAGKAECAQVQVPLDYRKPKGKKISIAVSRVKHTDTKNYQGVLFVNPGGPGGSGLAYSDGLKRWLGGVGHANVAAKYDIIGFDPRGVGSSKPALTCDPNFSNPIRPDYVPRNAKEERAWIAKSRKYAADCKKKFGWLLPHMRTTNAAHDVNAIRAALGAPKISWYGFSYGTYYGATYATLFPKRVKRMVLDGNVNPKTVWYDAQLEQNKAFERNIKLWFRWTAKYDSIYKLGKTQKAVEARYYKLRAAAKKAPIGGKIGPSELDDIVLSAGYNTGYYIPFAQALSAWAVNKDPKPLLEWLNPGGDDNGFAVYNAVQGADAKWPRNWSKWHKDAVRLYKQGYRFNTWSNVWFNAPVAFWPVKGGPALKLKSNKALPGILMVQSELDGATPVAGGYALHKVFPSSRLVLELGGKTHSNTLNGNKCLDDRVAAYLDTGKLPKSRRGADAHCKAVPALNDPNPNTAKAASGTAGKDLPVGRP